MKRSVLTILLVVLMFLSSGIVVKPALGQDLYAYARAIANQVDNQVGPKPGWATAQATFAGPAGSCASVSDVYVQRVGGIASGPEGGWLWHGIGARVWGWSPGTSGNSYAEGWFESAGPLTISVKGAVCQVKASGSSVSENRLGIRVTDGQTVLYDVAVEYGWSPEIGTYFRQINLVGAWQPPWQVVQQGSKNLVARHPGFAISLSPAPGGLGRSTLYSAVHAWPAPSPFCAQAGSDLQSDEVSGSLEGDETPLPIPTLTEWGMIIMFVVMATGLVWFVVRQRRRMAVA